MNAERFYETRREDWHALSTLLDRGEDYPQRLSPGEVQELSRLYRAVTADLALAQRDFPQHQVTRYLNQLVGRGHALVYRREPLGWGQLRRFVMVGYPRAFQQTLPFVLAAALLFLVPGLLAGLITNASPEAARWLLPPQVQELVPQIEEQRLWTNIAVEDRPYASSFIMRNNIQVIFLAFAGGMLAGLLTVYIMVANGLLLGGLSGLTAHYDVGFELWTFVIGHGVVELSVIFIAGGAGLALGWAMLQPGLLRRRDALYVAARRTVLLIIGCVPLLVLAGAIEGFISPNELIPWPLKWAVGIGSGLILHAYLMLGGRLQPRKKRRSARESD